MTNSLYRHKNLLTHKCRTTQRHAESRACQVASLRLCPGVILSSLISSQRPEHFPVLPNSRQDVVLLLSDAGHLSQCAVWAGGLPPPSVWRWMAFTDRVLAWWSGIKRKKMCSVHHKHISVPQSHRHSAALLLTLACSVTRGHGDRGAILMDACVLLLGVNGHKFM